MSYDLSTRPVQLLIRRKRNAPLTEQDYAEAKKLLLGELESLVEFSSVDGNSPEERIERARKDKSYFARTYLPHYYTTKEKPKHESKIFQALGVRNKPVVLTAFRHAGKSTDAMVEELHSALFSTSKFIVHMMDSHDKAMMYTLRLLTELQSNKRILHDFGLCVRKDAGMADFEIFDPETGKHRSRIYAMGMKMSIRGLVSGNSRPDLVICEDLQNSDSALSEKQTKKLLNKLLADISFCFDQIKNEWGFIVIGNIICSNSVIDRLLKYAKSWVKLILPAEYYDKAGRRRAMWAEVFSLKKLDEMRRNVEIGGDAVYRREMLCQAVELEGEFNEDWFRHHSDNLPGLDRKMMIAQVDPSFADRGDCKAMIIGPIYKVELADQTKKNACDAQGKKLERGEYYVGVDVFCRQCSTHTLIRKMYEWDRLYKPAYWRCDGTASQKYFMKELLDEYAANPEYYRLAVKFTDQDENKEVKIAALQPLVEGGYLLLPERSTKDVENLIVQFTRHGNTDIKDDGPDVTAEWIKSLKKKFGSKRKAKVTIIR